MINNLRITPYTDGELAEIKRTRGLRYGDWARMTPAQQLQDINEFWAELEAVGNNINKLDPNDPAWFRDKTEETSNE